MGRRPGSKNKPKVSIIPENEPISITTPEPKKRGRKPKQPREPFKLDSFPINPPEDKIQDDTKEIYFENSSQNLLEEESNIDVHPEPETILEEKTKVNSLSIKKVKKNTPTKTYPLCDCCHKEIFAQPHRIDTNILTAQVADYHRETPRWVELCSECARKLSDAVDTWLRENGCLTKFEIKAAESGITYDDVNNNTNEEKVDIEDDFQF